MSYINYLQNVAHEAISPARRTLVPIARHQRSDHQYIRTWTDGFQQRNDTRTLQLQKLQLFFVTCEYKTAVTNAIVYKTREIPNAHDQYTAAAVNLIDD